MHRSCRDGGSCNALIDSNLGSYQMWYHMAAATPELAAARDSVLGRPLQAASRFHRSSSSCCARN